MISLLLSLLYSLYSSIIDSEIDTYNSPAASQLLHLVILTAAALI